VTALVLDTRALVVLADRAADPAGARKMHAMIEAASRLDLPVRVPAGVLAEAFRGTRADAAVDRILARGVRVVTTGRAMARIAGGLRHRDGLDSCHVVDALVVATTVRLGGGIVATGDVVDLRSLARDHRSVRIEPVS
jgi:predicted nucleic acid-binding protein